MSPIGSIIMCAICIAFLVVLVWVFRNVLGLKEAGFAANILPDLAFLIVMIVGFATLVIIFFLKSVDVIVS